MFAIEFFGYKLVTHFLIKIHLSKLLIQKSHYKKLTKF